MTKGLSHLAPQTAVVETPCGSFAVRALSHHDLRAVYSANEPMLFGVLDGVEIDDFGFITMPDQAAYAKLEAVAAILMIDIIARAADEPNVALAGRLPQGVQLDALDKIAVLAFERGTARGDMVRMPVDKNPLN
jgi:hypothetical protein